MKDRFSDRAKAYALFRPTYPVELYEFILKHTSGRQKAWDVGAGNGQVACRLAANFESVLATDVSQTQLQEASQAPNITYVQASASHCPAADQTIDLITIGQALHWFPLAEFFDEVERVARPGAVLAAWGYSLCSVSEEVDRLLKDFYRNTVGPFWDAERKWVDEHYQTMPFPNRWRERPAPALSISFQWTLDQFAGYLSTWSAVRNYLHAEKFDPVAPLIQKLSPIWQGTNAVHFPLFLRIFEINLK